MAKTKAVKRLIKDCPYKVKKRCRVFGTMCSFPVNAPIEICGQGAVSLPKKSRKRGK